MKVAIIGAGINGLYLAKKLADLKNEVTVFDKKKEIGNSVCSGMFSRRLLDFIPESESLAENRIKSVKIHFPKKTIDAFFSKEFLIIDHSKLDKLAASLAQKSGAKIILESHIKEMPKGFDFVIGCDGYDSFVRKSLNLLEPELRLGIQGFTPLTEDKYDYVEVWPQKSGFIWKIPRGKEIEYGIISKPFTAALLLNNFLKKRSISLNSIKSKLIPQAVIIPRNNKISLCGDAAGLTKPWSGGGVIWGLFAADMLVRNFPDLDKYSKEANGFFSKKVFISKIALKLAYFFGFKFPIIIPKKVKIESDFLF